MAYATYTTEALVCGSRDNNTSDRAFLLFTREAGMIWATARSVREERSKQRYALQDFSTIRASLVKGKGGWRIGSVESLANMYSQALDKIDRGAITRLVRLVRQFLQGEERHPELYDDLLLALRSIVDSDEGASQQIADLCTFRILYKLGYIANNSLYADYLSENWISHLEPLSKKANEAIEKAFSESHL